MPEFSSTMLPAPSLYHYLQLIITYTDSVPLINQVNNS